MSDKIWMFVQIIPRPRLDIAGTTARIRIIDSNIEDVGIDKTDDCSIQHVEFTTSGLFFQIDSEDTLLFFGKVLKPGSEFTERKVFLQLAPRQKENISQDDGPREDKGYTEIRLTLFPKHDQPKWLNETLRKKENRRTSNSYWKKIVRQLFQGRNKFEQPTEVHKQS